MIRVLYGYLPKPPHGWARTGRGSDVVHVYVIEPYNNTSVCGMDIVGCEFSYGNLCRKCATLVGITSMDDCEAWPDEIAWGQANQIGTVKS